MFDATAQVAGEESGSALSSSASRRSESRDRTGPFEFDADSTDRVSLRVEPPAILLHAQPHDDGSFLTSTCSPRTSAATAGCSATVVGGMTCVAFPRLATIGTAGSSFRAATVRIVSAGSALSRTDVVHKTNHAMKPMATAATTIAMRRILGARSMEDSRGWRRSSRPALNRSLGRHSGRSSSVRRTTTLRVPRGRGRSASIPMARSYSSQS